MYGHKFSALLGGYQEVRWLDCMVRIRLVYKKLPKCLPKWLYHFAFPAEANESSCCSTSLPAVVVVSVLDFGHSAWYIVVSHWCFNLHFPDDKWCGASFHIFIYCQYIFFGELSKFLAHFFKSYFFLTERLYF